MKTMEIYPWSISASGLWRSKELYHLRDNSPADLAEMLWERDISIRQSAIIELGTHGNPRKGAEVVRAMIEQHPELRRKIREDYWNSRQLFDTPLLQIPGNPGEFSEAGIKVEYIQ